METAESKNTKLSVTTNITVEETAIGRMILKESATRNESDENK